MPEITDEQVDEVGGLVDSADNFLALLGNPFMADAAKIDAAKHGLRGLREKAKGIYHELGGEEFKDE